MDQGTTISALVNQLVVDYLNVIAEASSQPRRRLSDWTDDPKLGDGEARTSQRRARRADPPATVAS